jgi:hypothetical protein
MISEIAKIKGGFLKYAAYRTYGMKNRLIILIVCGVLGWPSGVLASVITENMSDYSALSNLFGTICGFLAVASAFVAALLAYSAGLNCFDYYNRREKVDMSWSLPVKKKHRFWGDFASGIVPLTAVYALSSVVGLLIAEIGFESRVIGGYEVIPTIASVMVTGFLTLAALYIIGVFCAALCGRIFETAAYPAIICGVIPALIGLFGVMVFRGAWQLDITEQIFNALAGTSPGGFLICSCYSIIEGYRNERPLSESLLFLQPGVIIPFVLIHGGFLAAAYYIGKKRKAEHTGAAFVFKSAPEIIIFLVVLCITGVYCFGMAEEYALTPGLLFGLAVCTSIAFLTLDVSLKRGFKKMGRAFLRYSAMLTCSAVISVIALNSNGFGIGEYVPPASQIESVKLNIRHLDCLSISDNYWYGLDYETAQSEFKDRAVIELLREINVESNKSGYGERYAGGTERITYTLKGGKKISRKVIIDRPQSEKLLPLLLSEEYKRGRFDLIDKWLGERSGAIVDKRAAVNSLSLERTSYTENNADAERIYEAFKKDFLAETFEQRFLSTERVLGVMNLSFSERRIERDGQYYDADLRQMRVFVFSYYTNLVNELSRQGMDVWNAPDADGGYECDFEIVECDYVTSGAGDAHRADSSGLLRRDEKNARLFDALLEAAQPAYLTKDKGYLVVIDPYVRYNYSPFAYFGSIELVVPPEYAHIARELLQITVTPDEYGEPPYDDYYGDKQA